MSTPKPSFAPSALSSCGRAGAAFAIGEVVADHDVGRAEPLRDHVRGEGFGAQARQLWPEIDDEGLVEPEGCEKLKLHRQRRQAKEGLVRRKELARMRLEHHGARALAGCLARSRARPSTA